MAPHLSNDTEGAAPQATAPKPMPANPGSMPRMTIDALHPARLHPGANGEVERYFSKQGSFPG
jgi:hypothetical protein